MVFYHLHESLSENKKIVLHGWANLA